ncbi:DUF1127 domain-containing protein [Chachezhania antarctica]|uniref:DUF1127 domain-containing protein n=1 Tax=Chachezhania antarctica TaxID=2340860 RepID=UPI000EAC7251|nr:DUF1127 domain-containing protein [Chachezhania antarctica]|tara:strand:- start:2659 stop:2871 length:213 start_codon:yes stop_codon:yes gene_type:complete
MTDLILNRVLPRVEFGNPVALLGHLASVRRERAALERLDDAALNDLGLTRAEARTESGRGFWDAPAHWTR